MACCGKSSTRLELTKLAQELERKGKTEQAALIKGLIARTDSVARTLQPKVKQK